MNKKIQSLPEHLYRLVWETNPDSLPRLQRSGINAMRIGHLIIRDFIEGQLTLRSMGLVYTTLLSMVPLLAVSFSVLKGFGVHNQVEPMLMNLLAPLGDKGVEITRQVIGFVDNIKVGVLGSLGILLLFYTVVSLLQKIERAFNYTWRVRENRRLLERFSDYLSIILIGPVLVFTALGITATIGNIGIVKSAIEVEAIGILVHFAGRLVPYLLMISVFTFIYILVPNTRVKFTSALVGGVVAGILWETTGWIFSAFIANSANYTAIYSVFASLIVFLIWLYLNWLILLVGCSIAFYYQHPEHRNLQSRVIHLSSRLREKLALLIMSLIAQHFYQNKNAWNLDGIAKKLNINIDVCDMLITTLLQGKLLLKTSEVPATYVPAHALETIRLKDVITVIRSANECPSLSLDSLPQNETIDSLYDNIENAIETSLEEKTLRDIAQA